MDATTASLVKLAEELTDRVDALETENAALRDELVRMPKEASSTSEKAPVVSGDVAAATVDALVKAGALTADQAEEGRRILMSDAEAPHRLLVKILDAQNQTKTASASQDDVSGGRLVSGDAARDPQEDCLDRMQRILGMF